ncbi:MAG: hypothetical protein H6757_03965 [Candidatus Omnitrophica bacterium]|nr:hypothetical protein [Candidatus Omnitrophota bacterium]
MAVHCPKCQKIYNMTEFHGGRQVRCACGQMLDGSLYETVEDFLQYFEDEGEREAAREIQQDAQEICGMILDERCADVDIEIAKTSLKEKVEKLFPDKMQTYEMIYEARFKRLWEQFRAKD